MLLLFVLVSTPKDMGLIKRFPLINLSGGEALTTGEILNYLVKWERSAHCMPNAYIATATNGHISNGLYILQVLVQVYVPSFIRQ